MRLSLKIYVNNRLIRRVECALAAWMGIRDRAPRSRIGTEGEAMRRPLTVVIPSSSSNVKHPDPRRSPEDRQPEQALRMEPLHLCERMIAWRTRTSAD